MKAYCVHILNTKHKKLFSNKDKAMKYFEELILNNVGNRLFSHQIEIIKALCNEHKFETVKSYLDHDLDLTKKGYNISIIFLELEFEGHVLT